MGKTNKHIILLILVQFISMEINLPFWPVYLSHHIEKTSAV